MAALLTNQTANVESAGSSHSGPCSVFVRGTFNGAVVEIQAAEADGNYVPVGKDGLLRGPGAIAVDLQGTYFLRAKLSQAATGTSVTVISNQ